MSDETEETRKVLLAAVDKWFDGRDPEVIRIKGDTYCDSLRDAPNVWMIEETATGFTVRQWSTDGVAPSSEYPDKRKAAARLLQLLGCGAVAPQTWPESVCVGTITYEGEAAS